MNAVNKTGPWMARVVAEYPDGVGCRDWPFRLSPNGYATVQRDRRSRFAGHLMLEATGRARPSADHHQLHSCDNRSCVAPWHLRWGTAAENRMDAAIKGRLPRKLTPAEARQVFIATGPQSSIADRFGVSQGLVGRIKRREIWIHATAGLS